MSLEFAVAEGFPELRDVPPRHSRIAEIKELDQKLEAASTLQNMSYAVRWTDIAIQPGDKVRYYLTEFDNATKQVRLEVQIRKGHAHCRLAQKVPTLFQ